MILKGGGSAIPKVAAAKKQEAKTSSPPNLGQLKAKVFPCLCRRGVHIGIAIESNDSSGNDDDFFQRGMIILARGGKAPSTQAFQGRQ